MLSFSTCWNGQDHSDGLKLVQEILALGFDTIEISHGTKISLLPGIFQAWQQGLVKISGVHNFTPSPVEIMIDAPDIYEYTSHRPFDRERALALTFQTIETAAQFGANYVVLHLGSTPLHGEQQKLAQMVAAGQLYSRDFVRQKLSLVQQREKLSPLYWERACSALANIAVHAEKHGVPVAVESRSHYEQMPDEREMRQLMEEYRDNPWVGYWHDFGHVQLKHNVGLLDHEEWLVSMLPFLLGGHIHDVRWPARDHRVPLSEGGIDYARLLPRFPLDKPLVWELSSSRPKKEIVECLAQWRRLYPH